MLSVFFPLSLVAKLNSDAVMSEMPKFIEQNQASCFVTVAIDTFAQVGTKHLDQVQKLLEIVQPTHINLDQYYSYRFASTDCDAQWQYSLGRLLYSGINAKTWFNNCRNTFVITGNELIDNLPKNKLKRLGFKLTYVKKMSMRHDELFGIFEELFEFSRCLKGIGAHEDCIVHVEGKFEDTDLRYIFDIVPMTAFELRKWLNVNFVRPLISLHRDTLDCNVSDFEPPEEGSILRIEFDTFIDVEPFAGLLEFITSAEKKASSAMASLVDFMISGKV